MTETLPETVTVELSLPSRVLSPNARCHWSVKAKARSAQREEARWVARSAVRLVKPLWASAHITVTPYYPDRRRRDTDNLLSALKAAIDGIVDEGILADDDRVTYTLNAARVDKLRPRVVLEITKQEETR